MTEDRTKTTPSSPAETLDAIIREIHYRLIRLTKRDFAHAGLSPAGFHLLHFVAGNGPVDMGCVHGRMHLSKSSLTSLVDGLVQADLLARDRSESDRRRVVLRATEAGRALLEEIRVARSGFLADAMRGLDDASVRTMNEALTVIREHLEG